MKIKYHKIINLKSERNKDMIIEMNKILKRNTSGEEDPRYNVGGKKTIKIEDIIDFHFRFERIHPFGD